MSEPTRTYAGLITDPIGESEARFIAQDFHDGQSSALYAFVSSGHLEPAAALLEAEQSYRELDFEDDSDEAAENQYRLMELIDYFERCFQEQER